jgi:hypothetical protein
MYEANVIAIKRIKDLLSWTAFVAGLQLVYYFIFNYNVAYALTNNETSKSSALGLGIPILAAVILLAYAYLNGKNIGKAYHPDMVRPKEGGPKMPKKLNKSQRNEYQATLRKITGSIEGMLIVSAVATAYWCIYLVMIRLDFELIKNASIYQILGYKYAGIILLIISTVLTIITTVSAIRLKKLNA